MLELLNSEEIVMINYSRKFEGISVGSAIQFEYLRKNHFNVSWYQCTDYYRPQDYFQLGNIVRGTKLPTRVIRSAADRLYSFPRKLEDLRGKKTFLTDPSLIKIGLKLGNFAVKVNDFIPLSEFNESFPLRIMYKYAMSRIKYAEGLLVSTQHNKKILTELADTTDNVFVVPEPVGKDPDEKHIEVSRERIEGGALNILYVASDRPYKNIDFVLRLAERFKNEKLDRFNFKILTKLTDKHKRKVRQLGLQNLHVYENIKDISEIYAKSDILIYPSLMEGFGRPIIEAMAYGIPIISNSIEPFKEIVGDGGVLLDLEDIDGWISSIVRMSQPSEYLKWAFRSFGSHDRFSDTQFEAKLIDAFTRMW